MLTRTEAIVLKNLSYGETSQIVTLFTRKQGKLAVLAKGARLPSSTFGSTLQPLSYIQIVYYEKPNRSLHLLKESSHVRRFPRILRDAGKITLGMRMLELTHHLLEEGAPHPAAFNLLLQMLDRLEAHDARLQNLPLYHALRMASLLGFHPQITREDVRQVDTQGTFDLATGRIFPETRPGPHHHVASRGALRALGVLTLTDMDTVMRMSLSPALLTEVEGLIHAYLRYHIDHLPALKSSRIAEQMHLYRPESSRKD